MTTDLYIFTTGYVLHERSLRSRMKNIDHSF